MELNAVWLHMKTLIFFNTNMEFFDASQTIKSLRCVIHVLLHPIKTNPQWSNIQLPTPSSSPSNILGKRESFNGLRSHSILSSSVTQIKNFPRERSSGLQENTEVEKLSAWKSQSNHDAG